RSQLAKIQRDYAELEGEHGRLIADLKRLTSNRRRLEVRSPIAGRVHALQVHTVGGVVAPGQELLKIVPSGASLIVEGAIQPQDIDQVARGQPVSIRLTSFNQRTTPELNGKVINVSADLLTDERKENYHYLVQIALDTGETDKLGQKSLVPGMPAEVFIQTEAHTVMDYLLTPLTDQFRRAMREQ
ncbi:MAG: HlyD family efflux transporter periplasmic adaptor subunit, partial [Pseudomonadota bacterium]